MIGNFKYFKKPEPLSISDRFHYSSEDIANFHLAAIDVINSDNGTEDTPGALQAVIPAELRNDYKEVGLLEMLLATIHKSPDIPLKEVCEIIGITVDEGQPPEQLAARLQELEDNLPGKTRLTILSVNSLPEDLRDVVQNDMIVAMKKHFNVAALLLPIKDEHAHTSDYVLACMQGNYVRDAKGKWVVEPQEKAVAQFLAMAVAKGLVDLQTLKEKGLLHHRQQDVLDLVKQLQAEGVTPILEKPVFVSERPFVEIPEVDVYAGEEREYHEIAPEKPADKYVGTYGPEDTVVADKAFEHQKPLTKIELLRLKERTKLYPETIDSSYGLGR